MNDESPFNTTEISLISFLLKYRMLSWTTYNDIKNGYDYADHDVTQACINLYRRGYIEITTSPVHELLPSTGFDNEIMLTDLALKSNIVEKIKKKIALENL